MYDENFKKIVTKTLQWEGGLVDNPADPGGRTNKGIIQKEYNRYRTLKNLAVQDVALISDDEVYDIYYNEYFAKVEGELYADSIKVQWKVFDIGVNMGVSRSLKFVQTIIGVVPDGHFGPKSGIALVNYQQSPDWSTTMMSSLIGMQTQRYKDIVASRPESSVFLKGWLRRAGDDAHELA